FERLDLTDAERAAIERLMADQKAQFEAAGGDVEKLRALKQATWQKLAAGLTPAQQQKLSEARSLERENESERGSLRPELDSLGLTPGQRSRLMSILAQGEPRARAIKEDHSLSDPQKQERLAALYQ